MRSSRITLVMAKKKKKITQNKGAVANWWTAERQCTERFMSEARVLTVHVQRQGLRLTAPEGSELSVSVTVKKHPTEVA